MQLIKGTPPVSRYSTDYTAVYSFTRPSHVHVIQHAAGSQLYTGSGSSVEFIITALPKPSCAQHSKPTNLVYNLCTTLWPSDWLPCALPAHTHAAQNTTQRRTAWRVNGEEGSQRPLLVRAVLVAGSWASPCESGTRIESPQCHCVPAAHPRRRRAVADSRACFAASPQGHMCAFECSPSCTFYSTMPYVYSSVG